VKNFLVNLWKKKKKFYLGINHLLKQHSKSYLSFFYIVSAKFYFIFGDNKKWPYFFEKLIAEIRKKYPSPIMGVVLNSQRIGFLPEYFQKNGFGAKVSDILYNTEEYKKFTEYMKNEEGFEGIPVHMEMADIAEIVYMKRWQELRSLTVDLLASAIPSTFITPYPFSKDLKEELLKNKNGIKKINNVVVLLAKYSSKNNDDISWYCSVEISYLLAVYSSLLEEHYIKNK